MADGAPTKVPERERNSLQPYSLPAFAYYAVPVLLPLMAVVAVCWALGSAQDNLGRLPLWCWAVLGLWGVVVGVPAWVSFARIWHASAVSILAGGSIEAILLVIVRALLIFKLPPHVAAKRKWFTLVYYGSLVLYLLGACIGLIVVFVRFLRRSAG
jgi:hypothetical protein